MSSETETVRLHNLETGDKVEVTKESAEDLLKKDNYITDEGTEKNSEETGEIEKLETDNGAEGTEQKIESNEGNKLKQWAESTNWLSAEDVEKGDIITILSPYEFQEYEGNESPVAKVEHNGMKANLRFNKQNTKNIAKKHGWDKDDWVGKQVEVVSIQHYPGVNAKGMILEPVT